MQNIIIYILGLILFYFKSKYDMQMFQQNGYNNKSRYIKFLLNDVIVHYFIIFVTCLAIVGLSLITNTFLLTLLSIVFMMVLILYEYIVYKKHSKKLPLKYTKRVIRLTIVDYIIFILFAISTWRFPSNLSVGNVAVYMIIHPVVLLFVNLLFMPLEHIINKKYELMAKNKLARMNNCRIIGITGSFGKTSTKLVLESLLSTKYRGFFTPGSYNTPAGNVITINNQKDIFNEYFISEMGAKKNGEIKEICDIVHPKFAIITSIGPAHLEFFKSLENICKTKFELVESLPKDGIAILNRDDEYQRNYDIKSKCTKVWIGIDNTADIMAKKIKITNSGTEFDIYITKEKRSIHVKTVLLGKKNVYNILASSALSLQFGLTDKQIIQGVANIKAINHRLEIRNVNNLTIIDDSYNSNPEGAKNALEVLSIMDGVKYIITPGMIEMGNKGYELNYNFGKQISSVCDKVYLIGKNQTKPIQEGLMDAEYDHNNVYLFNDFMSAYNDIMKKYGNQKSVVLIENDLPDTFTEG